VAATSAPAFLSSATSFIYAGVYRNPAPSAPLSTLGALKIVGQAENNDIPMSFVL